MGHAICDFASHRARLVIEIDGGQHCGAADTARDASDVARDAMIGREGYRVVRFWNNEVLSNTDSVMAVIWNTLHCGTPPPSQPSP